jgi:hypothetical protein
MKKVYDEAQLLNATEREQLLKEYGLRNVEVTTSIFQLCAVTVWLIKILEF